MKKSILIIASLLLITGLQARNHDIKILPERAQNFLVKSFPDKQIRYIEAERDFDDPLTYEVNFTDGVEVEFDKNGRWLKVDCTPFPDIRKFSPWKKYRQMKKNFGICWKKH